MAENNRVSHIIKRQAPVDLYRTVGARVPSLQSDDVGRPQQRPDGSTPPSQSLTCGFSRMANSSIVPHRPEHLRTALVGAPVGDLFNPDQVGSKVSTAAKNSLMKRSSVKVSPRSATSRRRAASREGSRNIRSIFSTASSIE
jgi:hypothetical protein